MSTPSNEGRHQVEAFVDSISRSLVFVVIQSNGKVSNGTAVLVQYRGRRFIVSALHVFNEPGLEIRARWNAARFRFRDPAPINFHESLNALHPKLEAREGIAIPLESEPVIDRKHDLIAAELPPDFSVSSGAEAFEIESHTLLGDPGKGASIVVAGTPFSERVEVASGDTVLHPFLEHVVYDPDVDRSRLPFSWTQEDHLVFKFSLTQDGVEPHGFSGAPVWVQGSRGSSLWTASPEFAGIVCGYHRRENLIQVMRAKHVLALLERACSSETAS